MKNLEKQHIIIRAASEKGFWPGDCWPPFRIDLENGEPTINPASDSNGVRNLQELAKAIERLPENEPVDDMYARELFFKLRDSGVLVRKPSVTVVQQVAPAAVKVDPAATLPHEDVPSLRKIRTLEDINELSKEQVRAYLQPAARDSGLYEKFNQRCEYIRANKLRRVKSEVSATTGPVKTRAQQMLDSIYAQIDALQPDYRPVVQKLKAKLRRQVQEMIQDRRSLEEIGSHVSADITDFVNGSIH